MAQETVKIRKVAGSLFVSTPVRVLEAAGLKEGDYVVMRAETNGSISITKDS